MKIKVLLVVLLMAIVCGCEQKMDAPVEVADRAKILRVFQSNSEIN
jgi:cytochrome c556